jgi:hypothetical protein
MKYTVKLLEADVISKNNRYYSKEVIEKINEQLNSNTVNVYNNNIYYDTTNFNNIVGQTIKCSSRIEANTLFIDVSLRKPVNAKFINICCSGLGFSSKTARKDYNGNITVGLDGFSHFEVAEPKVLYLFKDNTNSYYNDSNIVSQNNKLEIE